MRTTTLALSLLALTALSGGAVADETVTHTVTEDTYVTSDQAQAQSTQDLMGTVQAVDRRNEGLILQDAAGANIGVALNENWHAYREGREIPYRDIEPNDHITLRYRS